MFVLDGARLWVWLSGSIGRFLGMGRRDCPGVVRGVVLEMGTEGVAEEGADGAGGAR